MKITTAAPKNPTQTINIIDQLRNPQDFLNAGGNPSVHALVNFGQTFAPLIGQHELLTDRDRLPTQGIIILADHVEEAARTVRAIDRMARRVFSDAKLYDDPNFCQEYYDLAAIGYKLLANYVPQFGGEEPGRPISLVRAGLVTTRLARGLEPNAIVPDEVQVTTKRVHPKDGKDTDLMVTVRWHNPDEIASLAGETLDIADFVNPASGASTLAVVLAARNAGATPHEVIHRSVMATTQGIEFMQQALNGLGIKTKFYTLGASDTLTPAYYLTNPGVGDAGRLLRHSQPKREGITS